MSNDETTYARPLLPLAVAIMLGIALGYGWPGHRSACMVAGAGFIWLGWRLVARTSCRYSPLILFLALGYLSIQPWAAPRFPSHHITGYADQGALLIAGRIDSLPVQYGYRQKFYLTTVYVVRDTVRVPAIGRIRVTIAGKTPWLNVGDHIQFRGHVRLLRNFNNPGGFDYKQYMAAQGVWASSYAPSDRVRVLARDESKDFMSLVHSQRRRFACFIEQIAGADTQGIWKALLIGDRRGLEERTRHVFQTIGIGHVLAISGLHLGIVGGVIFFVIARLLGYFPFFLWKGWTKKGAALLAVVAVWSYGLLTGMSPSTQRAVVMVSIFFLSLLIGRRHDILNTIAAAAIGVLLFHPPSLISVSFQLSFAAVVGIVTGLKTMGGDRPLSTASTWFHGWQKIRLFCLVSVCAIFGTLPLGMVYFHQVSLVGVISNLFFVPLIGFCVVPPGLLSLCLQPFNPVVARGVLLAADGLLGVGMAVAEQIASWPFAAVMTVIPSGVEIGWYYICILSVCVCVIEKRRRDAGEPTWLANRAPGGRWCCPRPVVVVAALCVSVGVLDLGYWCYQRFWRQDLRVTVLDVGQGTANLLELPGGKTCLIDGGGFSDDSAFDVGKQLIAPFLLRKKICTVDEIILSHPDSDHVNGLIYIAENFGVRRLRHNNESADTLGYRRFIRAVQNNHTRVIDFSSAPRTEEINGVTFKFLYPPDDYMYKKQRENWRNTNNNSLVVQVRFGEHTFLFPGDIQAKAESELARIAGDMLVSDVLVAPHHGSKTSSSGMFLDEVKPRIAVFSAGWRNLKWFPHPAVLARYRARDISLYHTALQGAVCFSTNGRQFWTSVAPTPIVIY